MIWNFELPLFSQAEIFSKTNQFCWCELKIQTIPIITSWNILKNMADFMKSLKSSHCPYCHEVKFSQKQSSFVVVIWKFELPMESRAQMFAKYSRFSDEVTWIFELPLLSWGKISHKNEAVLLMWLENLNCPYYHELKFSQKYGRFMKSLENSHCPYYHEVKLSQK